MDKYTPGKLVWVRMRSYPWWPAEIVSPDEPGLSEEVLEEKKPNTVLVRFFGEGNYCWSPQKNICSFRRNYDSHSKNNSRGLRSAIKEAVELEQEKGTSDIESEGETKKAEGSKRKRETAKPEDASANGEGAEPPKKKRGRPRKSESTETTPKKRKQPDSEKKQGVSKKPKEEKQASEKDEKKKGKAEDDKDEERRKKRLERKQERREERRKKRKEEKTKDDGSKSKEGAAASPKKDPSLVMQSLNKHLRKAYAEHNEARILQVLKKLKRSTGTVTLKNLHESGLGKTVKRVTKHNNSEIRDMANELLSFYMALMDEAIKTGDISQLNLAKAEEKKREAEAEAAAKKDTPPADGEPTVQQNGDSADKDVTMADAPTEDTTGGGGEEKAVVQPAPQQQEPKEKEEAEEEEKKSDSAQSLPPAAAPEPSDEGQKAEEKEQKDNVTGEQPSGEGEKVNEAQ